MSNTIARNTAPIHVWKYFWVLAGIWTLAIGTSLAFNIVQLNRAIIDIARAEARTHFEKDVLYRRWSASLGGVYGAVTERTHPNPYLSHISERDIQTPSGRALTLINPAYMSRQIYEMAQKEYQVTGHLTSLNPINPVNSPDPWEAETLEAFNRGEREAFSLEERQGEKYMRYMQPFVTVQGCLTCHAVQGYKEGEIRGGISISVPMAPMEAVKYMNAITLATGHGMVWLLGFTGLALGARSLKQRIREREEAEEALVLAKEEWECTFDAVPNLIAIIDQHHRFIRVNKAMAHKMGMEPHEAVGLTCYECVHGTTSPPAFCPHSQLLADGKEHTIEVPEPRLEGEFLVTTSPLFDPQGRLLGSVHVARDVTQHKKLEEELFKARKLEAVGTFAGGMAHDFNNLLEMILGSINLAQMDVGPHSLASSTLHAAEKAVLQARDLTREFITFATGGPSFAGPVVVKNLIMNAMQAALSGSNIEGQYSFADDLLQVEVDEREMIQVVGSMVTNAGEVMPNGGTVRIIAENATVGPKDHKASTFLREGQYVRISIEDQGKGIPPEDLGKIFDPYFSTKGRGTRKGTGLSLAKAHSIVKKHGGSIQVESKLGIGTTFHIYLPVSTKKIGE